MITQASEVAQTKSWQGTNERTGEKGRFELSFVKRVYDFNQFLYEVGPALPTS